ncbi:MAG: hypothetical protein ACJAZO_000631 [Myxococcota bacterium]|jgi:hypothetical protein
MRILIIEDGHEYTDTLTRFAGDAAEWMRAGNAAEGLTHLAQGGWDAAFLDMRFNRVPDDALLGDVVALTTRFAGDRTKAIRFLQENQGTLVLSAIRAAGYALPVLFSYNFDEEPRRWARVHAANGRVGFVPDSASPMDVAKRLAEMTA